MASSDVKIVKGRQQVTDTLGQLVDFPCKIWELEIVNVHASDDQTVSFYRLGTATDANMFSEIVVAYDGIDTENMTRIIPYPGTAVAGLWASTTDTNGAKVIAHVERVGS